MEEGEEEQTIACSLFEALYVRALTPDGDFLEALCEAGFNPSKLQSHYPLELWPRCLEIARRHLHPNLSRELGMRALGALFIKGYYATTIGRVNVAAMPLLGMERTLRRVPRVLQLHAPALEAHLEQEGPGLWRLELVGPGFDPDFCAGMIEAGAEPFEEPFAARVIERGHERCVLELRY